MNYFIFSVLTLFSLYKGKKKFFLIVLSFVLLVLFQIEIQHYFNDYINYSLFFNKVEPLHEVVLGNRYNFDYPDIAFEFGFKYFTSFLKVIFEEEFLYFLFINIVLLILIYIFLLRNACNFFMLLLAFYAIIYPSFHIGILRQSIANAFFLIGLNFFLYGKKKFYFLFVALASTFHSTGIILLFLPFFIRKEICLKFFFFLFIIGNLLYLFNIDLISTFLNEIALLDMPLSRVDYYLTSEYVNNYLGIGFWDRTIQAFLLYYIYIFLKNKGALDDKMVVYLTISFFSLLLQLYSFNYPIMTNRIRFYFYLFPFFVFDRYIYETSFPLNKGIISIYWLSYCLMMLHISTSFVPKVN